MQALWKLHAVFHSNGKALNSRVKHTQTAKAVRNVKVETVKQVQISRITWIQKKKM